MTALTYTIDDQPHEVSIPDGSRFYPGVAQVLSSAATDITWGQPWYDQGHTTSPFLSAEEFASLQCGLTEAVGRILAQELGVEIPDLDLSRYHEIVGTDSDHLRVVSRTRDLFAPDFGFPIMDLIPRLGALMGFELTDRDPVDGARVHIIVRINRPGKPDYNPPHKDIYSRVDLGRPPPRMMNFWIPIYGVSPLSSLPIAPGSHLIPEDRIVRTRDGGVIEGNRYRVRTVKEWDGRHALVRSRVSSGEVLVFSSFLIHGLAINTSNATRVALEFRLFRA